jgi:hypothetical protein
LKNLQFAKQLAQTISSEDGKTVDFTFESWKAQGATLCNFDLDRMKSIHVICVLQNKVWKWFQLVMGE